MPTFSFPDAPECLTTLLRRRPTAYGVKVPLFVDNAESVTNLLEADTQIIRLVVSENDKEIRVSYEN